MKRPNIVLVLTDDQGPWALGCCGTPELSTPNLDALAQNGLRMDRFYCASPVCSPARASLMTGLMPSCHGILDWISAGSMAGDDQDGGEPILYLEGYEGYTDVLARHGYACGLSGKWHMGNSLRPQMSCSYWYA
ncbi:MAG TPA: sulfatase-like hydrolase/transferase, partial [Clostridia bacterium]|nr:sulfatase-like hydrolase/transferase [Clostridia bacterium]